ncbi:MAG: hypothetical protein K2X11_07245, partial [Acetobacteraceae bacterium]|nr:hypothetical protein [Acetobacteraceae bacterium]
AAAAAPAAPARPADPPVPVFDMNGLRIGQVPAAMVRGTPHGIPILVNRGGQNITVTVGSPPNPGTVSAGRIGRVGSDTSGRVVVERQDPRGDLSPAGTPRFVGTGAGGAPIFTFE